MKHFHTDEAHLGSTLHLLTLCLRDATRKISISWRDGNLKYFPTDFSYDWKSSETFDLRFHLRVTLFSSEREGNESQKQLGRKKVRENETKSEEGEVEVEELYPMSSTCNLMKDSKNCAKKFQNRRTVEAKNILLWVFPMRNCIPQRYGHFKRIPFPW